jgi:hypothetical protein
MSAERGGVDLMPEQGTKPVNKYLPPRQRKTLAQSATKLTPGELAEDATGFFGWLDSVLEKL